MMPPWISYQSKRRCSKTLLLRQLEGYRSVTSQNDAAPKRPARRSPRRSRSVTSQNDAAPKPTTPITPRRARSVTSQNDAAPKLDKLALTDDEDQLPVKTTLLQNAGKTDEEIAEISYQSKRRCSKTVCLGINCGMAISYQSKRRCSKTRDAKRDTSHWISYQSKRRCSKTRPRSPARPPGDQLPVKTTLLQNVSYRKLSKSRISYQSKRRCSKTH